MQVNLIKAPPASALNAATISVETDGTIHFASPDEAGSVVFFVELDGCLHDAPAFLRIDYQLDAGELYATLVNAEWQVLSPTPYGQGPGGSIHLYIEHLLAGMKIMIGVQSIGVKGKIIAISTIQCSSLDVADCKRLRAQEFPAWYADADLGDGLFIPASIPADQMVSTRRSYTIMRTMLEEVITSVSGKRGVDIGCASGFHAIQLARSGAAMTGVDPFDHGIRQARFVAECNQAALRTAPQFVCQDIYQYKPEEPFDFFYCVGVLYHLADPIGALRRLYELGTIGGVLGCCVSPTAGDFFELSNSEKYSFCQPTEFTLVPTATALRRACEQVGFKVLKMADWSEFEGDPSMSQHYPGIASSAATTEPRDQPRAPFHYVHKDIDVPIGPVYYALAK